MAVAGGRARVLTVGLILSLLALCVLTAALRGAAAAYAKEAEAIHRQKRSQERALGEIKAEVRSLKAPGQVEARLAAMKSGKEASRGR